MPVHGLPTQREYVADLVEQLKADGTCVASYEAVTQVIARARIHIAAKQIGRKAVTTHMPDQKVMYGELLPEDPEHPDAE